MYIRYYALLLLVFTLCTSCTAQKSTVRKTVMFATIEDFKPGPDGGIDLVWSTGRINDSESLKETLQRYDSLMLGQTWLAVDKESFANLDDEQILTISKDMVSAIKAKMGQRFKLVDSPSESTLRLSIALTNLDSPNPILTVTNSLLPEDHGVAAVSKIITGEYARVDGVTVELLVSDSRTNKPLIVVIDKRFGNNAIGTTTISLDEAKEAISLWIDRLWTTLSYWNWI